MKREKLEARLENLPDCVGIYTFKDAKGKIIYVGKAKSLRSRVRSYFRDGETLMPRTSALSRKVRDLDFIATRSEVEALILECNLIKHFKPRYNVNLKDDKKYPYIKVTTREPFPSVYATRNLAEEGARYFGPYTDAKAMRRSLKVLIEIFPVRMCKRKLPLTEPDRGCLNYHIGKCVGPCRGDVSEDLYKGLIQQVCQYLSGRMSDLIRNLKTRMEEEASKLNFEEASRLRDRLRALEKMSQKQIMVSPSSKDRDIVAVRGAGNEAVGFVLKVREGKLVGKEVYRLSCQGRPAREEIVRSFLEQYLSMTTVVPDEVVLEEMTHGIGVIGDWLTQRAGRQIRLLSPKTGKGRELLEMAGSNAELYLSQIRRPDKSVKRIPGSVKELGKWLNLPLIPVRIAAFDISTIQGAQPVGSRVFFRNGRRVKGQYRRYSIETVKGQDDFAMMREVLARSWSHVDTKEDEKPDLVLVDGGPGQVSSAIQGMIDAGCDRETLPPVVGLAKRLDELYVPDRTQPIQIPHTSSALRLLQRIRDEAHRFAVTYHRKRRRKEAIRSELEEAKGIGPVLAKRLLTEFGSLREIEKQRVGDLVKIKGMSKKKAELLLQHLRSQRS